MTTACSCGGERSAPGCSTRTDRWTEYWEGTLKRDNRNIGALTTQSVTWMAGYGLTDRLSVLGMLPYVWTELVHSEVLHYGYAVIMLVGIWMLLPGFVGRSRAWWLAALVIQFWHHIEHALLQGQAIAGRNLFGAPVPTSILQLVIPRLELHLFYNTVVFIPMVVAMYHHVLPSGSEAERMGCTCAFHRHPAQAAATPAWSAQPHRIAPRSATGGTRW